MQYQNEAEVSLFFAITCTSTIKSSRERVRDREKRKRFFLILHKTIIFSIIVWILKHQAGVCVSVVPVSLANEIFTVLFFIFVPWIIKTSFLFFSLSLLSPILVTHAPIAIRLANFTYSNEQTIVYRFQCFSHISFRFLFFCSAFITVYRYK